MAVIKNKSTVKGREFWNHVETVAAQMKGNDEMEGTRPENTPEIPSSQEAVSITKEIYIAAHNYRHAPITNQQIVLDAFYEMVRVIQSSAEAENRRLQAELAKCKEELKSSDEMHEAQQQKYEDCPHKPLGEYNECGCSFDNIGDVCGRHSPALKKAQADLKEAVEAVYDVNNLYGFTGSCVWERARAVLAKHSM